MNIKAIIYNIIFSIVFILLGYHFNEIFYVFIAISLLYAGYNQKNIKEASIAGLITAIPIAIMGLLGYFGSMSNFYKTPVGMIVLVVVMLFAGAVLGLVGRWARKDNKKVSNKKIKGKRKK